MTRSSRSYAALLTIVSIRVISILITPLEFGIESATTTSIAAPDGHKPQTLTPATSLVADGVQTQQAVFSQRGGGGNMNRNFHFKTDDNSIVTQRNGTIQGRNHDTTNSSESVAANESDISFDDGIVKNSCKFGEENLIVPSVPDLIIIGAQKAGTSALSALLRQNPHIRRSKGMETHFFDQKFQSITQWKKMRNLTGNVPDTEIYCDIQRAYAEEFDTNKSGIPDAVSYQPGTKRIVLFEKTPSYLFQRWVPEQVIRVCPWQPKIVAILRNPIDRAVSHYRMTLKNQWLRNSGKPVILFEVHIKKEIDALRESGLTQAPPIELNQTMAEVRAMNRSLFSLLDQHLFSNDAELDKAHKQFIKKFGWSQNNFLHRGLYYSQLLKWNRYFEINETMMVVDYDYFESYPRSVYSHITQLVKAPYIHLQKKLVKARRNTAGGEKSSDHHSKVMSPATLEYLRMFYRPYNDALESLLGRKWRHIWDIWR